MAASDLACVEQLFPCQSRKKETNGIHPVMIESSREQHVASSCGAVVSLATPFVCATAVLTPFSTTYDSHLDAQLPTAQVSESGMQIALINAWTEYGDSDSIMIYSTDGQQRPCSDGQTFNTQTDKCEGTANVYREHA